MWLLALPAGGEEISIPPGGDTYTEYSWADHEATLVRVGFVYYIEPEPTYIYASIPSSTKLRVWPVPSKSDAEALVAHWARGYGIDEARAAWTVNCESGFNAAAKNKTSSAAGLWQFLRSTFNSTAARMGMAWTYQEHVLNAEINAQMGAWLAANDSFSHWECGGFQP